VSGFSLKAKAVMPQPLRTTRSGILISTGQANFDFGTRR
jgi:hypothetical protein